MIVAVLVPSLKNLGPIIVAKNIAKFSENKNVNFVFISLRKNSYEVLKDFERLHIKYFEINMGKFPTKKDTENLKNIIQCISPDIIHCHGFWPDILASNKLSKYKLITTIHNNPLEDYKHSYGNFISKIMIYYQKKALYKFDKVAAISKHVKNVLLDIDKSYSDKVEVIYNGVEDHYKEAEISLSEDRAINLISVGVLNKIKNIQTAIKAAGLLIKKGYKIKYIIVGDGPEKDNLKKIAKELSIDNYVQFLGKKEPEDVFNYLKESDICIFPSISEGLGLAAIEALMMGKPVVASNISVMNEIIEEGQNGFTCDVLDENKYAEAVERLYKKNKLDILNQCRNSYLEKFEVSKMCREYENLYKRIVLEVKK